MPKLTIQLPEQEVNYPINIQKGLLQQLVGEIQSFYQQNKIVIITDTNVAALYRKQVELQLEAAKFDCLWIVIPAGESSKNLNLVNEIYSQLIAFGMTRSDLIIALGGGVVGDLSGYIAATYLRGLPFMQIPTTLLAQVDSSVGGKVAVDLPQGKNLIGTFYHPDYVLIDSNVLATLPDSEFSAGCAEVIKYGCIQDAELFVKLQSYPNRESIMAEIDEIIALCCQIKANLVQADEKDTGVRMLLNFGHTLGHAIEAHYHYQKYNHGQAISIGMVAINQLSETLGQTAAGTQQKLIQLLEQYALPTQLAQPEDWKAIIPLVQNDKKNYQNQLFVILLEQIGQAQRKAVTLDFFEDLMMKGGN